MPQMQCWRTVPVLLQCFQHVTCSAGCCDARLTRGATQGQARTVGNVRVGMIKCKILFGGGGGGGGGEWEGGVVERMEHGL